MRRPCLKRTAKAIGVSGLVVLTLLMGWTITRFTQPKVSSSRDADARVQLLKEHTSGKEAARVRHHSSHQGKRTPSNVDETLEREMKRRLDVLDAACAQLNIPRQARGYTAPFFDHLIVVDPYKLLFNFIPKVSCSPWKKVLGELISTASNYTQYTTLDKFTPEERMSRLETYRKVVFVREPITRLLSAWMNKFRDDRQDKLKWEAYFGKAILKRYRKRAKNMDEKSPMWINVTFTEFARYVTSQGPHFEIDGISDHFALQSDIANPCQINYHFIGHFENLALEGPYLLRWLSVNHLVTFPRFHPSAAGRSFKKELASVPSEVLNGLGKLYKRDYELFGYSVKETLDFVANG